MPHSDRIAKCPSCGARLRISGAGRFRCPACGAVFEVSDEPPGAAQEHARSGSCEFHPTRLATHICQGCGALICDECTGGNLDYPLCPRCRGEDYRHEDIRDWRGYLTDLGGVLFKPQAFFSSIPARGNIGRAMLLGIGWAAVGRLVQSVWAYGLFADLYAPFIEQFTMEFGQPMDIAELNSPLYFIGGTFGSLIWIGVRLILATLVVHLCLMIFGGANQGLEASLKGMAYSQAAYIWSAVPLVGPWVAFVWWIVCATVALKNFHRTTTTKSLFAVLTPILVLVFFAVIVVILFFALLASAITSTITQMGI